MRPIVMIMIVLGLLPGCAPTLHQNETPGTTTGLIHVGSPKLLTREALSNDRVTETAWLQEMLKNSDSEKFDSVQGLTESNVYRATVAKLGLELGPKIELQTESLKTQIITEKQRRDEDLLDHHIRMVEKQKKLEKLQGGITDQPNGNSGSSSPAASGQQSTASSPNTPDADKNLQALKTFQELMNNSKGITPSTATSAPIERLRDKLALRQEIRDELLDTQLDDRHVRAGSTLYRLKVDSTIHAGNDTSAWAVVEYEILPPSSRDWARLIKNFEHSLGERIKEDAKELRDLAMRSPFPTELPDFFKEKMLEVASRNQFGAIQYNESAAKVATQGCAPDTKAKKPDEMAVEATLERQLKTYLDSLTTTHKGCQFCAIDEWVSRTLEALYRDSIGIQEYADFTKFGRVYPFDVKVKVHDPESLLKEIGSRSCNVYAYAVTPKETVQLISQTGSEREARSLLFDLAFMAGKLGGNTALQSLFQHDQLVQALRRQPLVVGYAGEALGGSGAPAHIQTSVVHPPFCDAPGQNGLATFGWIQGPRFRLNADSKGGVWDFRAVTVQNGLSALIVIPAWWDSLRLKLHTRWAPEGDPRKSIGQDNQTEEFELPLKPDYLALVDLLTSDLRPMPLWVSPSGIEAGKGAKLLIFGRNLWRNTAVTLKEQRADQVLVLPDARGIIATFNNVREMMGDCPVERRGVIVWTGEGNANAGDVYVSQPKAQGKPQ